MLNLTDENSGIRGAEMTTDMTFCANFFTCSVQHWCKRAMLFSNAIEITQKTNQPISFTTFFPEQGKECEGFWKKAPLSLNPLENK